MFGRGGPSLALYYAQIEEKARGLLDREKAEYLRAVDFEEYLDHLVSELAWDTLEWDRAGASIEPFTAKEQIRSQWDGSNVARNVERMRLRVPVSHHPQRDQFMRYEPSQSRSSGEPNWRFEGDVLVVETGASKEAVERAFDEIDFWIGGRNRVIEQGNATIRARVEPIWKQRRDALDSQRSSSDSVVAELGITLHLDPASAHHPVEIRPRVLRPTAGRPVARAQPQPPALDRSTVVELVDFIDGYARQFETAPATYTKLEEEELRDLIIGMMNANYPGQATGETFSKLGKTDITFRVDDGNVLIVECKIWQGAVAYLEALAQLFRYVTWRQSYGILLHFCRLKNMTTAVTAAKQAVEGAASFIPGSLAVDAGGSRFSSKHRHPQDPVKAIEVFHLFIDLSS